jgi:hypothetical protein
MKKRDGKRTRKKTAKKPFDCVEMKHRIQADIYRETKDLTPRQELEFWRRSAEAGSWGEWWKKVHRAAAKPNERASAPTRKKRSG